MTSEPVAVPMAIKIETCGSVTFKEGQEETTWFVCEFE